MAQDHEDQQMTIFMGKWHKTAITKKKRKKKTVKKVNPHAWMVTFSDLITLMMTFFILLYTFNDPNPEKLETIAAPTPGLLNMAESAFSEPISVLRANSLIKENIQVFLSENSIRNVEVSQRDEGLIVTIPTDILFEKDSDELNGEAKEILHKIASYLNKTGYHIRVEGHTDNRAIQSARFQDHWELSLARAYNGLQEMLKAGIAPVRLSLVGKGVSQPRFSNKSAEGRRLNRRLELIILNAT